MHINFLDIHIQNFMSIGDIKLNLNNQGYTLISGINNNPDDLAKSNGSGKSSLFEAIIWCLTGDTLRGTKQVVNKFLTGGTSVELNFKIDNDYYKLIRYKDHIKYGTNLKIFINNIDKSGKGIRDTEKLLESYLPDLTISLLGSVIILGQGLPQRFTNNTPSGRKEVLEQMSKSDFMILDIKDKLTNRKIILNNELRFLEDSLLELNTKQNLFNQQKDKLYEQKKNLVDINSFDAKINELKNLLEVENENKLNLEKTINNIQKEIDTKLDNYNKLNEELNITYNKQCEDLKQTLKLDEMDTKLKELYLQGQSIKAEIKRLENIKDVCPTCGQKIPDVHKVDTTNLHKDWEQNLAESVSLTNEYNKNEAIYNDKCKQLKETLYKDINNIKENGQELRKLLNNYNEQYKLKLNCILEIQSKFDQLNNNKVNNINIYKSIEKDIAECELNIKENSEKILYNNIDIDNKKNHLDIVNKMITIATRDFRGFLLSEIIDYINDKAKEYSQEIFETTKIDFTLDGNNISISYCDKQYENLSGGEKQKVDLIIQFSIRDMLSQFLGFSSNILVCDEIFDNCDSVGCQKIINMISKKLNDLDSIFIITHHENDLAIPYDLQINIIKNELGVSEVYM